VTKSRGAPTREPVDLGRITTTPSIVYANTEQGGLFKTISNQDQQLADPQVRLLSKITSRGVLNKPQEVIIVTRDRIHLCLQVAMDRIGKRDRWMVPLGVLVPLVLAVTTTTFTKRFGIGGGEWETVFVMFIVFTAAWLVYSLVLPLRL